MKKNKLIVLSIAVLATLFWCGYCGTKIYVATTTITDETVETNSNNEGILSDELKLSLKGKEDGTEQIETIAEYKEKQEIEHGLTKEELDEVLAKDGYMENTSVQIDNILFYEQKLLPNKYYIKEYNGTLAVYKSNSECQLCIEDEDEDVYYEEIDYSMFSEEDKNYFKNNAAEFSTKEEARNYMTQFLS